LDGERKGDISIPWEGNIIGADTLELHIKSLLNRLR